MNMPRSEQCLNEMEKLNKLLRNELNLPEMNREELNRLNNELEMKTKELWYWLNPKTTPEK